MKRQIIILFLACTVCTFCTSAGAQEIRRPPTDDSIWCQMWPDTCADKPFERVAPEGPVADPTADYILPKTVGVTQIEYELDPINPKVFRHFTTFELLQEMTRHDIRAVKIWLETDPFDGMGTWCWETPWGQQICHDQCEHNCDPDAPCNVVFDGEEMRRVWTHPGVDVIFLRPTSPMWSIPEYGCMANEAVTIADAPYYEITRKLYEEFWWRDLTVILGDWEQDWVVRGRGCKNWDYPFADARPWYTTDCQTQCSDGGGTEEQCRRDCGNQILRQRAKWLSDLLEGRQEAVARARREAWIQLGFRPKLTVLHAAVVNKYPANAREDEAPFTKVTEIIPTLKHKPDLIGLSFWKQSEYLGETLDWIQKTTGYPKARIYLDEIGWFADDNQYDRIYNTVSRYWNWGGRLAFVWLWRQTWCGENRGLFEQVEPCEGKVEWGEPTGGYLAVKDLNEGR